MIQQVKMLPYVAEVLFYIACSGALASEAINQWVKPFPPLGYGLAVIAATLIIQTIIATASSHTSFLFRNIRMAFIISLLAVAAVHLSSKPFSPNDISFSYPSSPLYFLYYAVIITFALFGRGLPLLAALFICCGAEILNFSLLDPPSMSVFHDQGWMHRATLRLPPLLFMTFAAAGPYFIITLLYSDETKVSHDQKKQPQQHSPQNTISPSDRDAKRESIAQNTQTKTNFIMSRQEMEETFVEPDAIDELLSSIVYFMSRIFKAYSSLGFIFDPLTKVFTLNSFHSKSLSVNKNVRIPLGQGMIGKLGIDKNPFLSGDLTYYSAELFYYSGNSQVNSLLAVPIISDSQELLGALVIDSQDKQAFKNDHMEIMRRFSYLAAALIINVRMRVYQERAAKNFRIFYEASQKFIPALHLDQVFDVLMIMIEQVAVCTRIMVVNLSDHSGIGSILKIRGTSPDLQEGFRFEINEGLYSYVYQKAKLVNIPDFQRFRGKYFRFSPEETGNDYIRSLIIIPIMSDKNQVSALISVESSEPDQFQGEMETILFTLVGNAAVALNRARLYRQMELLAITDGLTQLINHKHFQVILEKEIERSKRYKRPVSLLIMDIDHFKSFNDTYGHPVGDLVLKEIAQCIREALRVNDTAARYGGEEFAVIIPENDERGAFQTAERIRQAIERKVIQSGNDLLHVTISIGCACFPSHAGTQRNLIERADKALYYSKRTGRNRVSVYVLEMESEKEK
jgi:diguanylate cyclase (GGDEF)-like protein